jgi:hypothetical protein
MHPGPLLQPRFLRNTLHGELPPNMLQAIGCLADDALTFTGWARGTESTPAHPISIKDVFAGYHEPSLQWALSYIERPDNLAPIATSIREGTAAAVTDESFKLQQGIHAFTLVDLASGVQLTGANPCPKTQN